MKGTVPAILMLTLAAASCSSAPSEPAAPSPSPTPPATTTSPTPSTTPETTEVTLWYMVTAVGYDSFHLAPERRTIPTTDAIARAALEILVHGDAQDPDHTQPIPKATIIRSLTIRDGVATVDWGKEILAEGHSSTEERFAIDTVTWTLTEFDSVERVRFTIEGKSSGTVDGRRVEDFWGHVGLSEEGWTRDGYIDAVEPVVLWTPDEGSAADGSVTVEGETIETELVIVVVRDSDGEPVANEEVTVAHDLDGHQPWRGTFQATIAFTPPPTSQTWYVEVRQGNEGAEAEPFSEDRRIRVG